MQNKFRCRLEPLEESTFVKLKNSKLGDNPLNYFSIVPNKKNERLWEISATKRNKIIYSNSDVSEMESVIKECISI